MTSLLAFAADMARAVRAVLRPYPPTERWPGSDETWNRIAAAIDEDETLPLMGVGDAALLEAIETVEDFEYVWGIR